MCRLWRGDFQKGNHGRTAAPGEAGCAAERCTVEHSAAWCVRCGSWLPLTFDSRGGTSGVLASGGAGMKICVGHFRQFILMVLVAGTALMPPLAWAQQSSGAQVQAAAPGETDSSNQTAGAASQDQGNQSSPLYRVTVVAKTTKAINYIHAKGSTPIDFKGTVLMPFAKGEARVEGKKGVISVSAKFEKLSPATTYGPQFLTYVLWAVTPEGRASNLGELEMDGTKAKVDGAAAFQGFGRIVRAEPYFAVAQPSDVVVLENEVRPDTVGSVEEVDAKFDLLERGDYSTISTGNESVRLDPRVPLSLYEARNAVQIAKAAGAEKYANDSFQKAQQLLQQAEDSQKHKERRKSVDMTAREAVQTAQDADSFTLKRLDEE